jgi:WD repeat-containing protein 61
MDSVIRVWDLEKGKSVNSIEVPPLESWTISAFGKQIATGSASGNVNLYNLETSKKEQSLDTQKKSFVMAVSYSKCGRFLACGSQDGSVCVFDVATSKLLHNLQGHSMTIRSVKFTNDSQKLITASDDKHIHVYDV